MRTALKLWFALLVLTLSAVTVAAEDDDLLPPEQAFQLKVTALDAATVRAEWNIAPGYYLYKERFSFSTKTDGINLGAPVFPAGKVKQDEFFGQVEIFHGRITVDIPVIRGAAAPASFDLTVGSQGCAEIGVCYPPQRTTIQISLPTRAAAVPAAAPAKSLAQLQQPQGGAFQDDEVLDPDVAFRFDADVAQDAVTLRWQIAPHHYLYRDKFSFQLKDGSAVTLGAYTVPAGEEKNDEFFGRIFVFHDGMEVRIPLQRSGSGPATLLVSYQGCAELTGICYPPIRKEISLVPGAAAVSAATAPAAAATSTPAPQSEQDSLAAALAGDNRLVTVLTFFGLGLLLAFTPCVFPMIPILSSIIVGQGAGLTTRKAFVMSLVYVLAMALTYAIAGMLAGLFGANLQAAFQNVWVLGSFSVVFVLLALSMFGFYELQLPSALQTKLSEISNKQQGGSLIGVAIMGLLSALIVGPCVAPPLMGAIIYIGQTGDAVLGFVALFALSLGMGAPLLLIGTSAGKLLPRAGGWMNAIKAVFGVMLLAVALWMLERILPAFVTMLAWALLVIISAIYMGALEPLKEGSSGWRKLWKGLGLALLIHGALLLIGAGAGGNDPLQPLRGVGFGGGIGAAQAARLEFRKIKTVADMEREVAAAAAQGKPVMLDFYADWCVSCKEFDKYTFSDPGVIQALSGAILLKADVTANDDADQAMLRHFKLIGPPSLLFFGADGKERPSFRIVGFTGPEEFRAHVERALR
ncbi:MAG: thiol:disulfide interchange protein [Gammaproteobacteria bacterium HGW-Gammaproteobacteria-1]|jgi:thiol:disulfide interchange protein DsbD|nr:MAG: thiol:disulfide interchange protein [Gammaproteobacteria bacterium HGW-Gammaproteobacteria-1]